MTAPPVLLTIFGRMSTTSLPRFAQERLWFLDELEPAWPLYNIPTAVHVCGSLDVIALEKALNELVQRDEILRTTFRVVDGRLHQVVALTQHIPLVVIDLPGFPVNERTGAAGEAAVAEARRPFDLARGPLVRTALIGLASNEHLLLVTLHHIIAEGESIMNAACGRAASVGPRPPSLMQHQLQRYAVSIAA